MSKRPAFGTPLHVGRPNIGDKAAFLARVEDMFDRRWLSNDGPCLQEFEEWMAEFLGVRHFIAVCNGTVGLEIMAKACGLVGEVIMPAFTFVATAHAMQWVGATPVFCDVDPRTHNIDPSLVEHLITDETTGILGVHVWGRPCDVEALEAIARRNGLVLVFDAAHALGCTHGGRMIGNFGVAECFSFHATKFFNTFEGGAITTNDDEVANRCRLMRNFGFDGPDNVVSVGTNGKMSEVSAAMGLTNLESMASFTDTNARNYRAYAAGLDGIPGIELIEYSESDRCNCQYVVIEIDETWSGLSRDELQAQLTADNVLARRYFYPGCHLMKPYASEPLRAQLPETERLASRTLSLPTGTAVDERDIQAVCRLIGDAVNAARG
ncbi:MAG: aminotransferase class I/II-fold pyridoxal phosphate-dependent enzyme [Clostridiales bacterium]|nr:aminotransferase class I/II-fold pyridoxal phosphate-dependent enzyme [Clostridiales bacterium]